MIEFGCCAFNFIGLGNEESLRLISGMGFKYADIEVISSKAQINQLHAAAAPEKVGIRIRELADALELVLAEFFVVDVEIEGQPIAPNHPDDAVRKRAVEQFRRLCHCAAVCGCRSVMVVPGSPREGVTFQEDWDISVATLRQMLAIARDQNLRLNVEPHSGSIATTPDLAVRLAQEVEGLTYVLDYAHFIGQGIPQGEVLPLHQFTSHMHGKPCSPGLGKALVHEMTIDFRAILADLVARDWDGIISMECIWPADAPNLTRQPAFQNALLAHKMELMLAEVAGEGPV